MAEQLTIKTLGHRPRVPEALAYLDRCGIDNARRRSDLKTMAQDAWQKG